MALRMALSADRLTASATAGGRMRPMFPIWRPIREVMRIARLERFSSTMARRSAASSSGDSALQAKTGIGSGPLGVG